VDEPADVGFVGLTLKEVVAAELGVGLAPIQTWPALTRMECPTATAARLSLRRPPRRQYWAAR
jgi:hypothetical protein